MKPYPILEEGNLSQLCSLILRIFQNSDLSSKQNKASDKGNIYTDSEGKDQTISHQATTM